MKPPPTAGPGESGQALLLVIVGLSLFLLGTLGLAIDGAQLYAQRQMAQTAADAAAQAGIMSIFGGTNATAPSPFATASPATSFTCTTTDGRTPCVYARLNGFGGTSNDTVTVTFPTTVAGAGLSASAPVPAIAVSVQRRVQSGLIRMIGGAAFTTVRARATAGLAGGASTDCMFSLDPSSSGAFSVSNGSTVTSGCGIAVKSGSSSAGTIVGGSTVTAPSVDGNFQYSNGGSSNPVASQAPWTGSDPYGSVPAPAVGACDYTNYSPGWGNFTLSPGVYCGGITINNGATAFFNPGVYIINGGNLSLNASTVSGNNVMFYLTGTSSTYGSVNIANGENVSFSAPATGTYTGVLFFQDRLNPVTAYFAGGVNLKVSGGFYFPKARISFSNGAASVGYPIALVSWQIAFTGGTNIFTSDPTGTKTGLGSNSVALIE